jgi:hypothetical protein
MPTNAGTPQHQEPDVGGAGDQEEGDRAAADLIPRHPLPP